MVVAGSRAVGGLVDGAKSVLYRNRCVLGSNHALGVVAGCRLEGQRGLHSICANHYTICYIYL